MQSWAMCEYARKLQLLPTRVVEPGAVPRCTVTNSRKVFPSPTARWSRLARVLEILRLLADGAESVEAIAPANLARSIQAHVMLQPAVGTEFDIGTNDAIRADLAALRDVRGGIDDGRGMNPRAHVSMMQNIMSASETTSPLTRQRPRAFTITRFFWMSWTSIKSVSPGTTGLRNFTASALMK